MKLKPFDLVHKSDFPENLIVFIHGFTGTNDTWQLLDGSKPFVDELLRNEAIKQNYNVVLFRYISEKFGNEKSKNILKKLIAEFKRKTIGRQKNYNLSIDKIAQLLDAHIGIYCSENRIGSVNLFFIAHSMGGIVAKEFICRFNDREKYVFSQFHSINVPHSGSDLAIIRNIFGRNIQAEGLMPNSDIIHRLDREWTKINSNRLPKSIYYVGYSDDTVDSNSALGSENRTTNVEVFPHEGGHSDFLTQKAEENSILNKVKIELESGLLNILRSKVDLLENEFNDKFLDLESVNPNCKATACLYHSTQTINKIVQYVNCFNYDFDEMEIKKLRVEIEFILINVRLYFGEPEMIINEFKKLTEFDYQKVYAHIFEYISSNLFENCNCHINEAFDKLRQKLDIYFSNS